MSVTPVAVTPLRRWSERARLASRFVRFSALGATVAMPLTGAVTSGRAIPAATAFGIAAVGVAYHFYGFVLNDVCDLEIDRTEPRRAGSPLVQGLIGSEAALAFALVNVPVAFALIWLLGGTAASYAVFGSSVLLGSGYDLLQKRFPWPPFTDLLQGAAWASLAWFGAEIAGGATQSTVLLMAFFIVFILMTNGVHASLRDLANDRRHGAHTTAILLGALPLEGGGALVTRRLRRYALTSQVVMVVLSGALLMSLHYHGATAAYAVAAWVGLSGVGVWLLVESLQHVRGRRASMIRGTQHLIVALGVVIAILAPRMGWGIRLLAIGGYVGPLLTYGWLIDALGRRQGARDHG
jgi:4-hydroxybenzoate polyprenyltransferase